MQKTTNQKGFTIIEVVLVLAIAGLIFLIVFLALPALQRSQRDTQRRNDVSRLMSQVTNFQSNNQGSLPANQAAWTSFVTNYLTNSGQTFADPQTGDTYAVTLQASLPSARPTLSSGQVFIYNNAKCGGANGVDTGSGSRTYAALIFQEQGGFYCQNN